MKREPRISLQIDKSAHAAVKRVSDELGLKQAAAVAAMARGWAMLDPDEQARALRPGADIMPDRNQMAAMLQGMLKQLQGAHA